MGQPVRVADLAKDLIRLSGLDEDEIEIVYTGVRPGEKLFEELFFASEDVTGTVHPKILRARTDQLDPLVVERLDALVQSVLGTADDLVLRELLHVLVPDFSRQDATRHMRAGAKAAAHDRAARVVTS
jgi:FlaA1/EpsC-like NDP-sugar epimerase